MGAIPVVARPRVSGFHQQGCRRAQAAEGESARGCEGPDLVGPGREEPWFGGRAWWLRYGYETGQESSGNSRKRRRQARGLSAAKNSSRKCDGAPRRGGERQRRGGANARADSGCRATG